MEYFFQSLKYSIKLNIYTFKVIENNTSGSNEFKHVESKKWKAKKYLENPN